jgi:hypothetical protein
MRQRAEPHVTVSVSLPVDLHRAVTDAADSSNTSFSAAVRAIVRGWKLQQQVAQNPEGVYDPR